MLLYRDFNLKDFDWNLLQDLFGINVLTVCDTYTFYEHQYSVRYTMQVDCFIRGYWNGLEFIGAMVFIRDIKEEEIFLSLSDVIPNMPWLVVPKYVESVKLLLPENYNYEENHPDINTNDPITVINGITDLQKSHDFLSSLNTKKRSHLLKLTADERWDEDYDCTFGVDFVPNYSFVQSTAEYWYDIALAYEKEGKVSRNTADIDKNKIFLEYDFIKYVVEHHFQCILETNVFFKKQLIGSNICLLIPYQGILTNQVCSIDFYKANFENKQSTHYVHFKNINFLYKRQWKWYCLGHIENDFLKYGTYKTHFRNGDFTCGVNSVLHNGISIPKFYQPPYIFRGGLIHTDEFFVDDPEDVDNKKFIYKNGED